MGLSLLLKTKTNIMKKTKKQNEIKKSPINQDVTKENVSSQVA
jgi:hypothetical protein